MKKSFPLSYLLAIGNLCYAIPILVLVYFVVATHQEQIEFTRLEKKGLVSLVPIANILQLLEKRSRLYENIDKNSSNLVEKNGLDETTERLNNLIEKIERDNKIYGLKKEWDDLKIAEQNLNQEEYAKKQAHFISNLNGIIATIGDSSKLILDPVIESYYLIDILLNVIPAMQNRMFEIILLHEKRIIQKRTFSIEDKKWLMLTSSFLKLADINRLKNDVKSGSSHHPFKQNIGESFHLLENKLAMLINTIDKIENGNDKDRGLATFNKTLTEAFSQSFLTWESLTQELENMLSMRIEKQLRDRNQSLYLSLLALVFAVTISTYLRINIIKSLEIILLHIRDIRGEKYDELKYSSLAQEMNDVNDALNYTSQLINERTVMLKNYADNLEKIIAEKTLELESQFGKSANIKRLAEVGEVAAGIAHEINNPLMVINGQILKLKRLTENLPDVEKFERPLYKINFMSQRIVKIINGLKLISRSGDMDTICSFSITAMFEEIEALIEMKVRAMNVDIDIDIDDSVENVYGRQVQISQVIVNLVNNSADAIAQLEQKWIKIAIADKKDFLEFSVTDSGKGISRELVEKITRPFFTTKEIGKGTGLGLSISKSIIEEHGGSFYYNEKSPHTQFVFTILKNSKNEI